METIEYYKDVDQLDLPSISPSRIRLIFSYNIIKYIKKEKLIIWKFHRKLIKSHANLVSYTYLTRVVRGTANISLEKAATIADVLGVPLICLLVEPTEKDWEKTFLKETTPDDEPVDGEA